MPTQTGSIDFKSTKGFQSYASGQYATLMQVKGQFATCSTAAGTQAKAATIVPSDTGWELYTGATITVRFTADNTHATPTLNVNSTGAKSIRDHSGAALTEEAYKWKAGDALAFTYDGAYWRMQDTLAQRVTTNKTAIEQNASDILLRATKTEASQMAQPNLAPIGSADFSDKYNATTNPDGYWRSTPSPWFTQLEDGWVHCYRDNTSGTAAANTTSWRPSPSPSVEAGKVYTILTEIRNNNSSGSSQTDMYLQQIANNQFWGDINGATIDDDHVTTTTSISLRSCGETYVRYSYRIADTEHLTTDPVELFRYNFRLPAGGKFDFDFRQSVYEGIYDGPYKPYVGQQLYASKAELKVAADGITSTVSSIASAKYVDSTTTSWPLASLKTYAAEGHSENWNVTSTDGLRVGDTVYVKGTDGTRNCTVYIKTTVTAINSATNFTGTSHGYEDVLPVESIKSTINQSSDSVKIQARHVEIDGEAIFSSIKDDVANQTALEHSGSGTSIAMDDAATTLLKALTVYGKSVQDGTPTPSAPVEIQSVGSVNLLTGVSTGEGWFYSTFDAATCEYTRSTTATGESYIRGPLNMPFEPGQTYTLSCWAKSNGYVKNLDLFKVHVSGGGSHQNMVSIPLTTEYKKIVWTFTCNATSTEMAYIRFDNNGSTASGTEAILYIKEPQLEVAAGTRGFVPDGSIGIHVMGKNLIDAANKTISVGDFVVPITTAPYIVAGTAYTVSFDCSGTYTSSSRAEFAFKDTSGTVLNNMTTQLVSGRVSMTLTAPTGVAKFHVYANAGGTYSNIQLELGSEATEYEPYRGTVTPIPLQGHELRSLPDGTHDELSVDADGRVTMVQRVGSVSMGEVTWASVSSSGVTYSEIADCETGVLNDPVNSVCSHYPTSSPTISAILEDGHACVQATFKRVLVKDSTHANLTGAQYADAVDGGQFTYPLATTQTIDLGTIDMPQVKDGDTVEVIAALTPSIDVTWWSTSGQVVADNVTVIDGGRIRTGSVTANQIAAGTITGNEIAGGTITSDNIEAGAISADRLDANALTVGNIAGLEDKLETITNGISSLSNSTQWVHFQDNVGTVFGEAGSANNVTVKANGVYFNTEGGEAARASAGIFYSNEMRANDSISTPILKMGNWALVQSGTTFSIEYLG